MAAIFNIFAWVIDIDNDIPKKNDAFLIDTNALFWMTYTKINTVANPRLNIFQKYQNYIYNAIKNGAKLFYSGLSLAELAHQVEKNELEIYKNVNCIPGLKPKEFRHNSNYITEQNQISTEIETIWQQVSQLGTLLKINIDQDTVMSAKNRIKNCKIDGYDLFILESMIQNGITKIITDDGDFSTVPGIEVFTANRNVISTALKTKHLMCR